MPKTLAITGNSAVVHAMKQIEPDVVAAFPITPSTQIAEEYSVFVANGTVKTELVTVESEHSAMSACLGASIAGGRVTTATSSAGMAFMWEILYVAASMRQPIVMTLVNRALSAPININCDHGDSMGARDAGWIQIYAEDNQEAYDNYIMAVRISEHKDVRLPVMVCMDGFIVSHCMETMQVEDDDKVQNFVGEYLPVNPLLNNPAEHPVSWGALDLQDYYMEHKRGQSEAIHNSKEIIKSVSEEFGQVFGRRYRLFEPYHIEDAERVIIAINSVSGEIKEAVDLLRKKGEKVGLLKIRLFRPFPYDEIREALKHAKIITVMDRSESFGAYGPLFQEIRTALYDLEKKPMVYNRIYGLGGREIFVEDVLDIFEENKKYLENKKIDKIFDYLKVREK